ncbi:MAG: hypothetical protein CK431_10235 [Mycobacterium sp.]|nr:MAG: hypothetical protein CK431_10235 [Mycobacterium sp.]
MTTHYCIAICVGCNHPWLLRLRVPVTRLHVLPDDWRCPNCAPPEPISPQAMDDEHDYMLRNAVG